MSREWETTFTNWARGPSATEQERAENAERQIRDAISSSEKLKARNISVFTQGSYRNRVNVRKSSDVDIGVLCFDTYFPYYPDDNVKASVDRYAEPATYTYLTFKNELEAALVSKFGRSAVARGNKAFDIKANTYRVDADVAAFFEHRRYATDSSYDSGVEMIPDNSSPKLVRNWPEQHYAQGVYKNSQTSKKYKRTVRILKTLANEMEAVGIESAKKSPSFLIECLVFNTPNASFNYLSYEATVRGVLVHLFNNTLSDEKCASWTEVSELKYLFRNSQPWTRADAHKFVSDAWDYIGYE